MSSMKLVRVLFSVTFFHSLLLLTSCQFYEENKLSPKRFLERIEEEGLVASPVSSEPHPELISVFQSHNPVGVYEVSGFVFALFDISDEKPFRNDDSNDSLSITQNTNLFMVGMGEPPILLASTLTSLQPGMGIQDLGLFVYPLGLCMILSLFVVAERTFSLRRGLTFPRRVEKALRIGEFPSKKWKKGSSAERIAWVATRENPSPESLRSYCALEISALEQGMFLLEVVIAGAPLVGLLGTVTGLVQVFSAMPAGSGQGIFSEGIAMALLTTIIGLAIAIPTLFMHSYLMRIIEKRAVSLNWLTTRLLDATGKSPGSSVLQVNSND